MIISIDNFDLVFLLVGTKFSFLSLFLKLLEVGARIHKCGSMLVKINQKNPGMNTVNKCLDFSPGSEVTKAKTEVTVPVLIQCNLSLVQICSQDLDY